MPSLVPLYSVLVFSSVRLSMYFFSFLIVFLPILFFDFTPFFIRNCDNIFLSSLLPVIGFTLSTFSLKFVRKIWENNRK